MGKETLLVKNTFLFPSPLYSNCKRTERKNEIIYSYLYCHKVKVMHMDYNDAPHTL